MKTTSVNKPIIIITDQESFKLAEGTNLSTSKPSHDSGGPGNTGSIDPTTPTMSKTAAKTIKIGSNI